MKNGRPKTARFHSEANEHMTRGSEAESSPNLSGRCVDISVNGAEIVELMIKNFATNRDVLRDHMFIAGADEIPVIITHIIRVGPRIAAGSIQQAVADLVAAT